MKDKNIIPKKSLQVNGPKELVPVEFMDEHDRWLRDHDVHIEAIEVR